MVMGIQSLMRNRNGGGDAEREPAPTFPQFSGLPTTFDPRSRRISEAAAGAAQYVIDLEAEVGRLKEEVGFERNSNSLLTETNKILHEQIAALEHENRKLRESNARTRTKLQISGKLVLEALDEANTWELPDEPAEPLMNEEEIKAAVEDAAFKQ